jgi:hypothetical protein
VAATASLTGTPYGHRPRRRHLARLEKAHPAHVASVRRHLIARLGDVDLGQLATAFRDITGGA